MIAKAVAAFLLCPAAWLLADDTQLKRRDPLPPNGITEYRIEQGRRIPVRILTTISTRSAADQHIDLQTVFPIVIAGRMVIPVGSFLDAELVGIHASQRAKARLDFDVRLNQLILPNGEHRDLRGCLSSVRAVTTNRGSDVVVVPGTTTEVLLQDPIVFPVDPVVNR